MAQAYQKWQRMWILNLCLKKTYHQLRIHIDFKFRYLLLPNNIEFIIYAPKFSQRWCTSSYVQYETSTPVTIIIPENLTYCSWFRITPWSFICISLNHPGFGSFQHINLSFRGDLAPFVSFRKRILSLHFPLTPKTFPHLHFHPYQTDMANIVDQGEHPNIYYGALTKFNNYICILYKKQYIFINFDDDL